MSTATVKYLGGLRTENTHQRSGVSYLTDAPVDNNGKGEAFSPTDTVATGLANCMLTIMGIKARDIEVDLSGSTARVTKHMEANPRRIARIEIELKMAAGIDERSQSLLERAGLNCPVMHSLHPDIQKDIRFTWM